MSSLPWQLFPRFKALTMDLLLVLSLLAIGIHVDGQKLGKPLKPNILSLVSLQRLQKSKTVRMNLISNTFIGI